ncbi:MAG: hypothetical protein U0946_03880 [Patescibacteria group bacterium]|nr:hypothetical protein [Patescibacteria group bacterium]
MKDFIAILSWLFVTTTTLILTLAIYTHLNQLTQPSLRPKIAYNQTENITSRSILPEVLGAFTYSIKTDDAIPEIIKNYLNKYNSPLLPYSDYIVTVSRDHRLDPRLIIAIAQQESNLCKKIPDNSHNCWGWGIHSQGTLKYTNYKQAIDAVVKGLAKNYLGKGLTTPQEIMGIYTPLSDGSWARGVQQFLDEMN